jgi:arginine decarboxylase
MLHPPDGKRYYLGAFIVGAYQEILGDLHNLFGDTNAVHIDLGPTGEIELTHVVEGDTVQEVLKYVQYDEQDLIQRLRISLERGLRAGLLTPEESLRLQKRFKESLDEYTYLKV